MSIAAVALSVSLLIVVASLFTGFINVFERAAVEAIGDVVLDPSDQVCKIRAVYRALGANRNGRGGNGNDIDLWSVAFGQR